MTEGSASRTAPILIGAVALVGIVALVLVPQVQGQGSGSDETPGWAQDPPVLQPPVDFARQESEFRTVLPAYSQGRGAMLRSLDGPTSSAR